MSIANLPLVGSQTNECFICEHSNEVEYWDTQRYLDLPFPDRHEGRKYVCRDCVRDAAKEFGFLTPEDAKALQDRNNYLEDEAVYQDKVTQLIATIKDAAQTIAEGYPGIAANTPEPTVQSTPDTAKVKGAKIVDTTTPEAAVTEDGRDPADATA